MPGIPDLLQVRLGPRRDRHTTGDLLHKHGAEARLIACRLTDRGPRRLVRWLDVTVPPERWDHVVQAFGRRPRRDLAAARLGPDRFLLRVEEPAPPLCVATYRAGGICAGCPLLARTDRGSWEMVVPRGERTRDLLRKLANDGDGRFSIARVRSYRSGTALTHRQDVALRRALDLGYFSYPRRGSLADVARALGVGRSAALEILRRGTAKLVEGRFGGDLRSRGPL